jgi:hypothetical protein
MTTVAARLIGFVCGYCVRADLAPSPRRRLKDDVSNTHAAGHEVIRQPLTAAYAFCRPIV